MPTGGVVPPISPVDSPPSSGSSGGSSTGSTGTGSYAGGALRSLTLGMDPKDRRALMSEEKVLAEATEIWRYARERNSSIRTEIDVFINFAFGDQHLSSDNLASLKAKPKRNITFDTCRQKQARITEPSLHMDVLPVGSDDSDKAQLVKTALQQNAQKRDPGGFDRKDYIDMAALWACFSGTGILHQSYDPLLRRGIVRTVDPRMFDEDPDALHQGEWRFCFETLRLPIPEIARHFPAVGPYVEPDEMEGDTPRRAPWAPANDSDMIRTRLRSGQHIVSDEQSPKRATVVLMWSQGEMNTALKENLSVFLSCQECGQEYGIQAAADTGYTGVLGDGLPEFCPYCGLDGLVVKSKAKGRTVPIYPRARRLFAFCPYQNLPLYLGQWSTPEICYWPYKDMRWYIDPRRWRGYSEVQMLWAMQVLVNKMLMLLAENATHNAAPKILVAKGTGIENKAWTNIPSEKLVINDPRMMDTAIRAFQTGDIGQSLPFLLNLAIRELRNAGSYDEASMGFIRSNSELSGAAIERAREASEAPLGYQMRQRFRLESMLAQDDFEMIRAYWSAERAIRLVGPSGTASVEWLKGDSLPDMDVIITSDPALARDRTKDVEVAKQLMSTPNPLTGLPYMDGVAAAEYLGVQTQLITASQERQMQAQAAMQQMQGQPGAAMPQETGPPALGGMGGGDPYEMLANELAAAAVQPEGMMG